jgi:hypothetical protein
VLRNKNEVMLYDVNERSDDWWKGRGKELEVIVNMKRKNYSLRIVTNFRFANIVRVLPL